jgi:environmental stress-induced protein Ves
VELREFKDRPTQPWLNGTGTTRELAASTGPDGSFDWRISLADVDANCRFSVLPGVDRVLLMCQGTGIRLTGEGRTHDLRQWDMLPFDGGIEMSCELVDGATRDLNVMTRRSRCAASVGSYALESATLVCGEHQELVMVLVDGQLTAQSLGPLSRYDAILVTGPGQVGVAGSARVLVAVFSRRTPAA